MKKINDPKIQMFLDELGNEYKEMLFEKLVEQADSLEKLSVSKLISIDNDVKQYLNHRHDKKKYRRLQLIGMLYACIGGIIFLFSEIMISVHRSNQLSSVELLQLMAIVMCFVGIIACAYPFMREFFSPKWKTTKEKKERIRLTEYEIIAVWRELEGICNDLSLRNRIVSNKSIIQLLSEEGLISEKEENDLMLCLKLRNSIVYNGDFDLSEPEIIQVIRRVERIIINIRKILYG